MTSSSVAITATLCAVSQSRRDSNGPAIRLRPTAYATTGTATVLAAMMVKIPTAQPFWAPDRLPPAMVVPAATHISRFFGFTADRTTPSPVALGAVKWSMALIHFGIAGLLSGPGRLRHWWPASRSSRTPRASFTQETVVDGSLLLPRSWVPASSRNTVLATAIPTTHPARNPALVLPALGASSMRMTAMIGTGEIATPTASGSRSPTTLPTAGTSTEVSRGGAGPTGQAC